MNFYNIPRYTYVTVNAKIHIEYYTHHQSYLFQ